MKRPASRLLSALRLLPVLLGLLQPLATHAYLATARTVNGTTVVSRLFLTAGNPAPVNTRIWFVADRNGDGVPTSPTPGAVLGADDVLIYEDIVDGSILGNQAGRYQRTGIVADDSLKTAAIYCYLWNITTPTDQLPLGQFVPAAGNTFGLFRIGVVAPPAIGNAAWDVTADIRADQHTVGGGAQNQPPVVPEIADQEIDELATLSLVISASDPNAGQKLTYHLAPGAPAGAAVDASSGAFTWTPTEAQGPARTPITVQVTDDGTPPQTTERTFNVTVKEVNVAPVIAPVADQVIAVGATLNVPLTVTDADLPVSQVSLQLVNPPAGVTLEAGTIRWTPSASQAGTNAITVQATDNGQPPLASEQVIRVVVEASVAAAPVCELVAAEAGGFVLRFTTQAGRSYQPQSRASLSGGGWVALGPVLIGTGSAMEVAVPVGTGGFFQVQAE